MGGFIKQIKSDRRIFDFSFLRIYTVNGIKFFVSVIETPTTAHHFTMQKRGHAWKIDDAPKVPDWIKELEPQLAAAIIENEPAA
jgi:hypothetical protein